MSNKRNARDASTSDDDDVACSHQLHANKRGRAVDGGTFLGAGGPGRASSSSSSSTAPPPSRDCSTASLASSSSAAKRGRVVRQRQYAEGMLLLNYQNYRWAKSLLSNPSKIANDPYYNDVVDNYLQRSAELRRRFDREYGDVVVFGEGN
jgi:hypothetical protein